MGALSALFFFIIERGVLMVLVFYYKGMLEKMQIKNPTTLRFFFVTKRTLFNAAHALVSDRKIAIECGIAFPELFPFLENLSLEFREIFWHENT